ncbi:MAG: tyrosine-type recombinase/integrase [Nocardioides sp.]
MTTTIPGITVWQRGKKWAYMLEGDPDPLTGRRSRTGYQGGFLTRDEALTAAVLAQAARDRGHVVRTTRIKTAAFFTEWLEETRPHLKPTAAANYEENITKYIVPILGDRWLPDLTAPVLNRFYRHLLTEGRIKGDSNQRMHAFWDGRKHERNGLGPTPTEIAKACDTSYQSAKSAAVRFRRGRLPAEYNPGLSAKSVQNIHGIIRVALKDAVGWGYLTTNNAVHAAVPRAARREARRKARDKTKHVWSLDELGRWLALAIEDRYAGMWLLAATTGMRRSELAGRTRADLDIANRRLAIGPTTVVVRGIATPSDGKSDAGWRTIALDDFTCAALAQHLAMLDIEQESHGNHYPTHGFLMVNEIGRPLHPDTITSRFNRLVDQAGARRIRLHDIRHTYATLALDSGAVTKILSDRVGHGNSSVTTQVYGHRTTGQDHALADQLGALIRDAITAAKTAQSER